MCQSLKPLDLNVAFSLSLKGYCLQIKQSAESVEISYSNHENSEYHFA
jgi:hypothetical protein